MSEVKQIAVVSREEAIQKAVDYCKVSKKPNVVPSTINLCFGLAGLVFIDSNAESPTGVVYFPVTGNSKSTDAVEMTSLPMSDRLDISGFFDTYGDEALVDINKQQSACYLPNMSKRVCAVVPFGLLDAFKSTQVLVQSLQKNNNKFYTDIIRDISQKAFEKSAPKAPEPEIPKKNPTTFSATKDQLTAFPIRDRIDLLALYDCQADSKLICAEDPVSNDSIIIPVANGTYSIISVFMRRASLSVQVLLDSMDNDWVVDANFLNPKK